MKTNQFVGFIFALLAALLFASQVVINRYVGLNYGADELAYVGATGFGQLLAAFLYVIFTRQTKNLKVLLHNRNKVLYVMLGSAFFGSLLTTVGQLYASPINSAVISTLSTISTAVISVYILRTGMTNIQKIALVGVVVSAYVAIAGFDVLNLSRPDVLIFIATILFGVNNVSSKMLMKNFSSNTLANLRMIIVGTLLMVIGLFSGDAFWAEDWVLYGIISGILFWLVIIFLYKAFHFIGPSEGITTANLYVIAVLAMSAYFFDASIRWEQVLGSVTLLISVYYATKAKKQPRV